MVDSDFLTQLFKPGDRKMGSGVHDFFYFYGTSQPIIIKVIIFEFCLTGHLNRTGLSANIAHKQVRLEIMPTWTGRRLTFQEQEAPRRQ